MHIIDKLKLDPDRNERVLKYIAAATAEGGNIASESYIRRQKGAKRHLELCLVHHRLVGGDFFEEVFGPDVSRRVKSVHRAMKKFIADGDIIGAFNDETLDDHYLRWRTLKNAKPTR